RRPLPSFNADDAAAGASAYGIAQSKGEGAERRGRRRLIERRAARISSGVGLSLSVRGDGTQVGARPPGRSSPGPVVGGGISGSDGLSVVGERDGQLDSERSNGDGHLPLAVSPLPLWQHCHLLLLDLRHDELLLCVCPRGAAKDFRHGELLLCVPPCCAAQELPRRGYKHWVTSIQVTTRASARSLHYLKGVILIIYSLERRKPWYF
ncbi:unnamed protein product, partial [Urochloa humidicola]